MKLETKYNGTHIRISLNQDHPIPEENHPQYVYLIIDGYYICRSFDRDGINWLSCDSYNIPRDIQQFCSKYLKNKAYW